MPRIVREADVTWEGTVSRGSGTIAAGSGAFESLPFSLPARIEKVAGRTSPEELLAAAHGGCFAMSLGSELHRREAPAERIEVRCTVTMDEVEGQGHLVVGSHVTARVVAPGADEALLAEAAEAADAGCPFSTLIRASAAVTVDAALA